MRQFNPPPGWPTPPAGWQPPPGWSPDPSWPAAPEGWAFWTGDDVTDERPAENVSAKVADANAAAPATADAASSSQQMAARCIQLEAELAEALGKLRASASGNGELVDLDDERVLQSVGIYRYHHPLENAEAFKERLASIDQRLEATIRAGEAIVASDLFTFDNSLAKGRRMTADLSKLMLRAYNAEAENCVRSLRAGNVVTAKKRLEASRTSIARLGAMMQMRISDAYHALRIEELELTSDYLMKVQEEREVAREQREQLRQERKAQQELAAERERLEKERTHLANALLAMQASGDHEAIAELQAKVSEIDDSIAKNDYRAANIRAGYVYVISNRGAFGPRVVKIGLTRRLDPLDRIRELSDASVPFPFDVHALFFSEDAVTLESELHNCFGDRRLNLVNLRREFFFATPVQVRDVLIEKVGNLLEFVEDAESTQYLQSRRAWPPSDVIIDPGALAQP